MPANQDLEAVVDACIKAHAAIEQDGTPEMRAVIRVLLHIIGREIARRDPSLRRALKTRLGEDNNN